MKMHGLFVFLNLIKLNRMDGLKKMSTGSLITHIVLIVAVALLYILFFTREKAPSGPMESKPAMANMPSGDASSAIAFVNSDLLLEKYELVEKLAKQLESESRKKDADLTTRQQELETEAAYFQESMQKQSLNEESAQRIYDQLMAKQQEIYQIREQYAAELSQKEFEMNVVLLDSVRNFLERMNADLQYDYILNYNASGSILQAKDTYDITGVVLEGLNKEYREKYVPKEK